METRKRTLGLNFEEGLARIKVWAPMVDQLELVLIESEKVLPLQKSNKGNWELSTNEIKEGDLYKLRLDGNNDLPDPASLSQPEGVHGASQALSLKNFNWQDDTWVNPNLHEYILYELHVGTFSEKGTFGSLEEKLDYLKELGINAIEIMPVSQFPGSRNWGYDGVYPYAVQNSYGGARALQHLVDTCHKKGIAVVLDVVYNHLGPEGNYFTQFGPYFTGKYNTPWGNALNFDDEWCDEVRTYFIENALMWFRDFHIDALRLDAVHAIKDFSPVHLLKELKVNVDRLCEESGRKHYLIVELDLNDTRFINPLEKDGFGMDSQWIDEFHHALRVTAGEDRSGYYSDFDGIGHLAKAYKDAYVYDGQYSQHRKKTFGVKTDNPGQQFIVFSQNHDQVGNRMLGERTSALVSFEMQKLLAGAVMISPYLPMLFMGEEWAEINPFLYFVSHTDPELAEAVRKGRKEEFAAFHAEGEAPDPLSASTFEGSKLQWRLQEIEPHRTMLNYYRKLIEIRKHNPALSSLNREHLDVECNNEQNWLTLTRWTDSQSVVCLLNFSKERRELRLPRNTPKWKKLLDSAEPAWKGPSSGPGFVSGGDGVTLQAESLIIYCSSYE